MVWCKGRMNQKHQAGFAELPRIGQPFGWTPFRGESGLQIDFTATARRTGHALCGQRLRDPVAVPTRRQPPPVDKRIKLIESVLTVRRNRGNPQDRVSGNARSHCGGIAAACFAPFGHFAQLHPADRGLYFSEAPVGSESDVEPAKSIPADGLSGRPRGSSYPDPCKTTSTPKGPQKKWQTLSRIAFPLRLSSNSRCPNA